MATADRVPAQCSLRRGGVRVLGRWLAGGLAVLGLACASGCAGMWWKPGAGPQDLARDQEACRETAAAGAAGAATEASEFERCMRAKNWWYSNWRRPAPTRTVESRPPAAHAALPDVAAPPPSSEPKVSDVPVAASAPASSSAPGPGSVSATPAPPAASAEPVRNRNLWWKFGGSLDALVKDQALCREASGLGPDEPLAWGRSAAFDDCMRERGWRGSSR